MVHFAKRRQLSYFHFRSAQPATFPRPAIMTATARPMRRCFVRRTQPGISTDHPAARPFSNSAQAAMFRQSAITTATAKPILPSIARRPGEWWIRRSSTAGLSHFSSATATDKPVQGDYTGDGKTDVAILATFDGEWFILRSEDFRFIPFPFGTIGRYSGAWRLRRRRQMRRGRFPTVGIELVCQRTTAGTLIQKFGANGDLPTPGALVP